MQTFFELIRVALGRQDQLSIIPSCEEWEEIYKLAKQQTLWGILYDGVCRLPKEQLPPKQILMKWYSATERIQKENIHLFRDCVAMSGDFKKDGRRHVILKGQGLATLYPNPLHRISGDIDVWLEGSRKDIIQYMSAKTNIKGITYHHCDATLATGSKVEVHFHPSWMNSWRLNQRLQRYFKNLAQPEFAHLVSSPGGYGDFPASSPAFNRVFLLVHIYRHLFYEGIGLRQLMDLYFVLLQGFTEDERIATIDMLNDFKMKRFTGAVMYVLQHVFGLEQKYLLVEPHEAEGRFLLSEIMLAGNFGFYDKRIQRKSDPSNWYLFVNRTRRNLRFLQHYPEEVICSPFFKIWHFFWRKYHGWL